MDKGEVETVVKSNFMRSYTAKIKTNEQMQMLPNSTKLMIEGLANKMTLIEDKAG